MVKNEVWGIPGPEERTCVGGKSRFPRTRRHVAVSTRTRGGDISQRYQAARARLFSLADAFPVDEASGDDAARGGEEFGVRAEWGAHDEDVLDESADRLRVDRGGAVDELVDELFDAGHDDLGAHGVCDEGHGAAARAALEEDVQIMTYYDLLKLRNRR